MEGFSSMRRDAREEAMTDLTTVNYRKCLVHEAKEYAADNGLTLAAVGRLVMNDQAFFKEIKGKRGCTVDTFQYIMRWFEDRKHRAKPKKELNRVSVS
jgi:hypothetical protein